MAWSAGKFIGQRDLAVDFDTLTDDVTAKYPVGTLVGDDRGNQFTYVKFSATTAKGDACYISAATAAIPYTVTPTSARAQRAFGISPLAHTANYFGWLQTKGLFLDDAKLVSASVANGDPVNATTTAGALDIVAATDIAEPGWVCITDDTDNTGTVLML